MIKKISLIVALSLVGIITVTTLILAFTNKNYKPELQSEPNMVIIVNEAGTGTFYSGSAYENNETFTEIVTEFNSMFSQSILNSMFSNNLFNEVEINYLSSLPTRTGYRIAFSYQNPVLLMKNGEAFKPSTDTQADDIYFEKLIFDITDQYGFEEIKMYAEVTEGTVYYEITTIADIQALYEKLTELSYN